MKEKDIDLSEYNPFELDLKTRREDGYMVSTIKFKRTGPYETAIVCEDFIKIVEVYYTKEKAIQGHEEYCSMSTYAIEHLESIE